MEKASFQSFCEKMIMMKEKTPDWHNRAHSLVADYLREGTTYGYGQVLTRLLASAYTIVKKDEESRAGDGGVVDLYELASLLFTTDPVADYRFSAYLFAVCVAGVSFCGVPIENVDYESFDENELIAFDGTVQVQEEADPQKKQLKKYGIRLLDFSRANQLVHFRQVKSATMRLFCADVPTALRQITKKHERIYLGSWKKLNPRVIYKCKICGRMEYRGYNFDVKKTQPAAECPICDAGNTHNRKSMTPIRETLVCLPNDTYTCICGCRLRTDELEQTQLICSRCGQPVSIESWPVVSHADLKKYTAGEMVCSVSDMAAGDIAKTLLNKAKNMERNFGLHVLYLAFGFLKWKDVNGTEYNSPLLLCPINLGIDKTKGQYYFEIDQSANSSFEVNKTLIQMLAAYSKTCSITLPPLDEEEVWGYFAKVKQFLRSNNEGVSEITKNWTIETAFGIGLFHYQKLQLQYDIEVNQDKYLQHPIIRRLCGDSTVEIDAPTIRQRQSMEYILLDADSSQEEAIKASQEGKSFILQGPPGSGKSQTITNIISSALGEGKTVLFVTEKASARSVIIDKMSKFHFDMDKKLTDFVLDFDGFKKRRAGAVSRAPFVDELNRCLTPYSPKAGYDDQLLADEQRRHEQVEEYMLQMRGDYGGRNYLRLLQGMAPYAPYQELDEKDNIPLDRVAFTELCDTIEKYYSALKICGCGFDYKQSVLYGCKGDVGNDLYSIAIKYQQTCRNIETAIADLRNDGWKPEKRKRILQDCVEQLRLWAGMPRLTKNMLTNMSEKKILNLIKRAEKRKADIVGLAQHQGAEYESEIDAARLTLFDLRHATVQSVVYRSVFKRLGKEYRNWLNGIFECFKIVPEKRSYKVAMIALKKLEQYQTYMEDKAVNDAEKKQDCLHFGYVPSTESEWDELIEKLRTVTEILSKNHPCLLDLNRVSVWTLQFDAERHEAAVEKLLEQAQKLTQLIEEEELLSKKMSGYIETSNAVGTEYPVYRVWANRVVDHRGMLAPWHRLYEIVKKIEQMGWMSVLEELIADKEISFDIAKARLFKTYYQKTVSCFIETNHLQYIRDFRRSEHEQLIKRYAETDEQLLESGARRLYETLKLYLEKTVRAMNGGKLGEYPKLKSKTNYSIKQTISENWDYIKRIKPCFMMSPLNVSQYIDADIRFDLVIFDEASQIFTEDALASIVRGRQVIIAGDSKQLPPCDFFRAGETMQDEDDQYYDEEANHDKSLLVATDAALSDASIALTWHYRSSDEALIAFANKEMEYNLISFPSAKKNANDGIRYVKVPYAPDKCYVAGKSGSHINPGEAEVIVELIYSEMTNPEREHFSIGVVAFSNAQAFEIEALWETYKQQPDKKVAIEHWEKMHADEPLIFCNLDTVQGDERDTTIISICYSPDADGKFILPYLGRIRLLSGKKRINVAITRARHQMVVVSMLENHQLKTAIQNSSAPEENKAGAQMLYDFLEYAQSFTEEREVVCSQSFDPFVLSVCRLLDENGIEYDTEIGRSECKISIGIRGKNAKGSFVLGIIIDDPGRTDFDSVREYARLTEQVLIQKYGWRIYRIYPTAWINDYQHEKELLLGTIRQAYSLQETNA